MFRERVYNNNMLSRQICPPGEHTTEMATRDKRNALHTRLIDTGSTNTAISGTTVEIFVLSGSRLPIKNNTRETIATQSITERHPRRIPPKDRSMNTSSRVIKDAHKYVVKLALPPQSPRKYTPPGTSFTRENT